MKKIISLLKVFLKININSSNSNKRKSRVFLLIGFGIYMLFVFSNFWKLFIDPLKILGQESVSINLILNISSILIFMTSITYIINILYFANDIENIIPFPFKPREIFTSKLLIAYFYELMIGIMLSLPGFLIYGVELKQNIIYYLFALIVFIFIPVIPIAVLSIFYTVFMQFFKINRYKNFFRIFSTAIILVAILFFQFRMNSNMLDNGAYDENYILEMCNSMKNSSPYYLKTAMNVFQNIGSLNSMISLIWYVLLNVLAIMITILILDKLYLRGVYNNFETVLKAKKQRMVHYKEKSKWNTIVSKEIKGLFRNVTFFIQTVLPTSFMPAVILISMLTSGANTQMDVNLNSNPVIKILFAFLIVQFFMMMNQISATAISRDGVEEAGFLKSLPVTKMKMIDGKAMPSIYVGILNLCIAMIFNSLIFSLSLSEWITLIVGGILLNYIQSYLFLIIDLKNPKLKWESEVAVVKHNLNVLKAIFLWFGAVILTAIIGNIFLILKINYFGYTYVLMLAMLYYVIRLYLKKNLNSFYEKIY